jgi:hypothetical protein
MFVMQPTRYRSGTHPEGIADPMAGEWCCRGQNEAGQVGK